MIIDGLVHCVALEEYFILIAFGRVEVMEEGEKTLIEEHNNLPV